MNLELTISDCMKRLETGEICTLGVWNYDRKRQKGGSIEFLDAQLLTGLEKQTVLGRPLTEVELVSAGLDDIDDDVQISRKPNHSGWYTRNVRLVVNGHPTSVIRKIHPPLIKMLNGIKTVP